MATLHETHEMQLIHRQAADEGHTSCRPLCEPGRSMRRSGTLSHLRAQQLVRLPVLLDPRRFRCLAFLVKLLRHPRRSKQLFPYDLSIADDGMVQTRCELHRHGRKRATSPLFRLPISLSGQVFVAESDAMGAAGPLCLPADITTAKPLSSLSLPQFKHRR